MFAFLRPGCSQRWERSTQIALLLLLALAILWRGGRTFEVTLLLSLVASSVVLFRSRQSRAQERSVSPAVWWLTMLFLLWTVAGYALSTTRNYGFDEVAQTIALALLYFWMVRSPEQASVRTAVLRVLVVFALLSCLIGVLVYAMGPLNRFVGTFLDVRAPWKNAWPNALAELLLLAWPVSLFLARPDREQGKGPLRTFWRIIQRTTPAGVMVGCLLLSYSRASLLVCAGQGIVLLLWAVFRRYSWKRAMAVAVGTFAIGLLVFGLSNHLRSRAHAVQSLSERALFLSPEGASSITERRAFWKQSFALAMERPFFGWGPGSFRFAQTRLMQDVLVTSDHPHNVFLKAAMERGWPAAFLLLALAVILLLPLLKGMAPVCHCPIRGCPLACMLSRVPRREVMTGQVLLFTGLIGVLAHNLVDFNLHFIAVSLPTVLIMGQLTQAGAAHMNKKFIHLVEYVLAIILFAAVLHEGFFAVTSTIARRADAQGKVAQALRWYGWSEGEWYSRDLSLSLARLQHTRSSESALRTIRRYTETVNPVDARGWVLQGEIAEAAKNPSLAMDSFERAYQLGRYTDMRILTGILPFLSAQGIPEADERKEEVVLVIKRYYSAILANSHFIALSPNVEEFVRVADTMAALFPREAPRYQVMAAGVVRQASAERLKRTQFQPKVLW